MFRFGRVKARRDGTFSLRLPEAERTLLRQVPDALREVLTGDDPAAERLFPPAYGHDPEADEEYRSLMGEELRRSKETALTVLEETIDADTLTEDQLASWLGALNDIRLVLGSRLDVTEDFDADDLEPDDPRVPAFAAYYYLSALEEEVVAALAAGLPDDGREHLA